MPGVSGKEEWRERCDQLERSTVAVLVKNATNQRKYIIVSALRDRGGHRGSVDRRADARATTDSIIRIFSALARCVIASHAAGYKSRCKAEYSAAELNFARTLPLSPNAGGACGGDRARNEKRCKKGGGEQCRALRHVGVRGNPLRASATARARRGRLSHQLSSKRPENASSFAGCNN